MKTFFHWIIKIWFHCLDTTTAKKRNYHSFSFLRASPVCVCVCVCIRRCMLVCMYFSLFEIQEKHAKLIDTYEFITTMNIAFTQTHSPFVCEQCVCWIFLIRISSFSCIFIKIDPKECRLPLPSSIQLALVHPVDRRYCCSCCCYFWTMYG